MSIKAQEWHNTRHLKKELPCDQTARGCLVSQEPHSYPSRVSIRPPLRARQMRTPSGVSTHTGIVYPRVYRHVHASVRYIRSIGRWFDRGLNWRNDRLLFFFKTLLKLSLFFFQFKHSLSFVLSRTRFFLFFWGLKKICVDFEIRLHNCFFFKIYVHWKKMEKWKVR